MSSRRRIFQIAEQIRAVIAEQLARTADPRFSLVTITSVVVSNDLRHAKVYWIVTGDQQRMDQVKQAFESAGGLFRRAISQELSTRFVPELRFYYDDTLDTCAEVERLFARINGMSGK